MNKFIFIMMGIVFLALSFSSCGDGEYEIDTTQGVASNILQ